MKDNFTKIVRKVALAMFVVTVLGGLAGWVLGRDPSVLTGLMGFVTTALFVGEASNIGKRATFKPEAVVPEATP
jgi:hypothetical protein